MVTVPIFAGASTYAVGKVFHQHFASGGTFLDFDAEKTRGYFSQLFEQGKKVAAEPPLEADKPAPVSGTYGGSKDKRP